MNAADVAAEGRILGNVVWREVTMANEVVDDDHDGIQLEFFRFAYKAGDLVQRQAEEFSDFAVTVYGAEIRWQIQIVEVEQIGAYAVFRLCSVADGADGSRLSRQGYGNSRFFAAFFDEVSKDTNTVRDATGGNLVEFARFDRFACRAAGNPHMRHAVALVMPFACTP